MEQERMCQLELEALGTWSRLCLAIRSGQIGQSHRLIIENTRNTSRCLEEGFVADCSQAGKCIRGTRTASLRDDIIVDTLCFRATNRVGWSSRTGIYDCSSEKRLAFVGVVAIVQGHLVEHRDCTS